MYSDLLAGSSWQLTLMSFTVMRLDDLWQIITATWPASRMNIHSPRHWGLELSRSPVAVGIWTTGACITATVVTVAVKGTASTDSHTAYGRWRSYRHHHCLGRRHGRPSWHHAKGLVELARSLISLPSILSLEGARHLRTQVAFLHVAKSHHTSLTLLAVLLWKWSWCQ